MNGVSHTSFTKVIKVDTSKFEKNGISIVQEQSDVEASGKFLLYIFANRVIPITLTQLATLVDVANEVIVNCTDGG
jgi:hypothetical protein